jgi:hypothetical protein
VIREYRVGDISRSGIAPDEAVHALSLVVTGARQTLRDRDLLAVWIVATTGAKELSREAGLRAERIVAGAAQIREDEDV